MVMVIILQKLEYSYFRKPIFGDKFSQDMDKKVLLVILFLNVICHLLKMDIETRYYY
jgi:hypothetical protein